MSRRWTMNRNIEIKARVARPDEMRAMLDALSDTPCEVLHQEDTFFRTRAGRLKLRVMSGGDVELIYYERPNASEPVESRYVRCAMPDPAAVQVMLSAALGVEGVVKKKRSLYTVGNARLHLDTVEGLGTFLEIEVVLSEEQTAEAGTKIAWDLANRLGIGADDLLRHAYIDLLRHQDPHRVAVDGTDDPSV
jgi:predicted adenylyl cyclase CyaB